MVRRRGEACLAQGESPIRPYGLLFIDPDDGIVVFPVGGRVPADERQAKYGGFGTECGHQAIIGVEERQELLGLDIICSEPLPYFDIGEEDELCWIRGKCLGPPVIYYKSLRGRAAYLGPATL